MRAARHGWRRLLLALLAAAAPLAAATTYVALTPQEVLELADEVYVATVTDVRGNVQGDMVLTTVTLVVSEWLSDDPDAGEEEAPRDRVALEILGGEAEGRRVIVPGSPAWRVGEDVLVAAHAAAGLASPLVGFSQGLWRFTDDGLLAEDGTYLALDANGALTSSDRPSAAPSVVDAVRAVLAGDAPEPAAASEQTGGELASPDEEAQRAGTDDEAEPAAADGAEPPATQGAGGPGIPSPDQPLSAAYDVDDLGGPLLLSGRLEAAADVWERAAEGAVELALVPGAEHSFEYGAEELFAPGVLTVTLAEGGRVRVLVRPEEHRALDAALRHELGALLGLPPAGTGVMSMAIADVDVVPGPAELAELAALRAFAPADLDRDGIVGFGDLLELAAAYGSSGVNLPADLDGDGDVDDDDLALLRRAYVFAQPSGAPVGDAVTNGDGAEADDGGAGQDESEPEEPDGDPDGSEDDLEEPDEEPDDPPEGDPFDGP